METSQKNALVARLAQNAVFDGWGDRSLFDAAKALDIDPAFASEELPTQTSRVLAHSDMADQTLTQFAEEGGLADADGVRGCLHKLIMQRFQDFDDVKLAVQKGVSVVANPLRYGDATSAAWLTADKMWQLTAEHLGQEGPDNRINHVSKRSLLTAVYSASMLVWFDDDSEDLKATGKFVSARLDNVVSVFGGMARVRDKFSGQFCFHEFLQKRKR